MTNENDNKKIIIDDIKHRRRSSTASPTSEQKGSGDLIEILKKGNGERRFSRRFTQEQQPQGITLPVISDPAEIPVTGEVYGSQTDVVMPLMLGETPDFNDVAERIKKINSNQSELEKITRMADSTYYKGFVTVVDFFKGLVGFKKRYRTIHELFIEQQQNIGELNYFLVHMTKSYGKDVNKTRDELDKLVVLNQKEHTRRTTLEGDMLPPVLGTYEELRQNLERIDRNDPKYHNLLKEVISAGRNVRNLSFQQRIATIGDEHHHLDIQNLVLQEDIFELALYRVMELGYITKLYQQTLDNNEGIWRAVQNLSEAVRNVKDGVNILSDYNRRLNESYIRGIEEIIDAVNSNPVPGLLQSTNAGLRTLARNVHSGVYRQQLTYITSNASANDIKG